MTLVLPLYMRYALFAAIATVINLSSQAAASALYRGPFSLTLAMIIGTGTGLIAKYLLDKKWIFFDRSSGASTHTVKFILYTTTGILTTALFWGMEYGFDAMAPGGTWRLIGAAIGLAIGYVVKYRLDRKFVFAGAGS